MIRKWAKLLPYWLVMYLTKKISPSQIKFNDNYAIGWRIDKGEWIVWSQENYNRMTKNEEENRQKKSSKKKALYEKLKGEFEPERGEKWN